MWTAGQTLSTRGKMQTGEYTVNKSQSRFSPTRDYYSALLECLQAAKAGDCSRRQQCFINKIACAPGPLILNPTIQCCYSVFNLQLCSSLINKRKSKKQPFGFAVTRVTQINVIILIIQMLQNISAELVNSYSSLFVLSCIFLVDTMF